MDFPMDERAADAPAARVNGCWFGGYGSFPLAALRGGCEPPRGAALVLVHEIDAR